MQVYGRTQEGTRIKGYLILQEVINCIGPAPKPWATIATPDRNTVPDWGFPKPFTLVPVNPDSIQYCSGMLDANGDEIASGDVIQPDGCAFVGLVEYRTTYNGTREFHVRWAKENKDGIMEFFSEQRLAQVWIENGRPIIIGNLWDTPELLPEQKGDFV